MTLHTFPATSKPTRTQDKRPHAPRPKLSKEARQVATARQQEAATTYSKDLSAAWKTIDEATENIAVKHHKSLRRVQSTLHMGRGAFTRQGSKKTTARNAYTWKTMKEQRELDGVGPGREALINAASNSRCQEEYKSLAADEKENLVRELNEHKDLQAKGRWLSNRSKINDISHTIAAVENELHNLKSRTGYESLLFTARGSTNLPIRGVAFATEGVEDFMLGTMKTDNQEFVSKLEGHAIQGLTGAAKNHKGRVSQVQSEIRRFMNNGLAEVIGEPKAEMKFKNYWRDIVSKYRVQVVGWPAEIPFANLSDVSSGLPILQSLLRKWECGTIYWKSISEDEFEQLDKERDHQIEAGEIKEPSCRQRSDKGMKRTRTNTGAPDPVPKRVRQNDAEASQNGGVSDITNVPADEEFPTPVSPVLPRDISSASLSSTSLDNVDISTTIGGFSFPISTANADSSSYFNGPPPGTFPSNGALFPPQAFNDILYPSGGDLPYANSSFAPGSFMNLLFSDTDTLGPIEGIGSSSALGDL